MIRVLTGLVSLLCLVLGALGLSACSPLALFDAIGPRDQGGRQAAQDLPFAEGPRGGLDVYVPVKPVEHAPVLVFFYGGSWQSGQKGDYAFVGQALAAQGFVTVVPDYRLYPEAPFPGFLEDGARAIAWVRDNIATYGGDPRRIVLAGHSAGAYNALMLALDPRYLRGAGVDPRTIRAVAGLSGPYDFLPFDHETAIRVFGDAPDKAATQPVTFVGPNAPRLSWRAARPTPWSGPATPAASPSVCAAPTCRCRSGSIRASTTATPCSRSPSPSGRRRRFWPRWRPS
ncbi:alpha/beta hydrolase [Methylobacterium gregans]|uniref:alpha/beta hydrolase n=1 Tax=Methylobacterium gregans TaxID=374424 RepID=UPI003621F43C